MNAFVQRAMQGMRAARLAAAAAVLAGLASCGGGVYVDSVGPPPDISLAVSPTVAQRGQPLQLVAAVSASNGIDYVSFYRIDFGTPVLLGSVTQPPAQWVTSVPINAGSGVSYFARVRDFAGYYADSAVVTVAVYP